MKRFITYIIQFAVLFFIIEKVTWLGVLNGPEKQFDRRIESVVKGEMHKELIILGSSRGIGNIIAGQLEAETQLSTYNLSYHGSNVNFQEFVLKTLLKYNEKPKLIVLSIDNPSQFIEDETLSFRDDMLKPFTRYNVINEALIERGVSSRLSTFLCSARLYKPHFLWRQKEPHKNNPQDSLGTRPLLEKTSLYLFYDKNVKPYDSSKELPEKVNAFKNIQALCKANGIALVYAISPSFNAFNYNFYKRFKTMVDERHIVVYDTLRPEYKNTFYYFDYSHLLKSGARLFTSEISTFINQNKKQIFYNENSLNNGY